MPTLTLPEAAQYLRYKQPETLRRLAAKGKVPARKEGVQWLFTTQALDRWVEGDYFNTRQKGQAVSTLEKQPCQSTYAAAPGEHTSPSQVASRYKKALERATKPKPKSCTTS